MRILMENVYLVFKTMMCRDKLFILKSILLSIKARDFKLKKIARLPQIPIIFVNT